MVKHYNELKGWQKVYRRRFIKPMKKLLGPVNPRILEPCPKGFTLIEIIVVIVILSIVSGITIKFLVDSMRIYTMTVNQKTLFDEAKLALERMCRDIRDARSITGTAASSVTFVRDNATVQDLAGENITFRWNGGANPLEKVKAAVGYAMASNVNAFAVANATNEIQLTLTLNLTSGENMTLQTKVYPKNLARDTTYTYKNFDGYWSEAIQ
jgi:prepilin-type N-terminal cleavage/methylation domain-containing protein